MNKSSINPDPDLAKLLRNREDPSIKDDVSKFLFHYHTSVINKQTEFVALGLKGTWGQSNNFDQFIEQEMVKYRTGKAQYDPLAVCCSVRKRVEKLVYDKFINPLNQAEFLATHTTTDKLTYAENAGIAVPEYYYLLGIIYNDGLHWRVNQDNITPIASKLENFSIKNLIEKLY